MEKRRRSAGQGSSPVGSTQEPLRLFDDVDFARSTGGPVDGTGEHHDERGSGDVPNGREVSFSNGTKSIGRGKPEAVRARASGRVKTDAARHVVPTARSGCGSDVRRGPSSSVEGRRAQAYESMADEPDVDFAALRPDEQSSADEDHEGSADVAPRLVTILRAAELLGVGRTTGYELVAAGELEVVHIGRSARIPIDSIDAYIVRLREAARPPSRGVRVRMRE